MTLAPQTKSPRKSKKNARQNERGASGPAFVAAARAPTMVRVEGLQSRPRHPGEGVRTFISSARPAEAILFERRDHDRFTVVTALVDRRTGMLSFIGEAKGLDSSESYQLRTLARGPASAPPLAEVGIEAARLRLARAILATQIGGGNVPKWLSERADLVGDPAHPASRVDDVYLCIACDSPLPVHEQVARAEIGGRGDGPPQCPHCRGDSEAPDSAGEAWLGRAWLMIAAGLPRRALVCAAKAEGLRLPHERLDAVRGAAHLTLGDRESASVHLRKALASEPECARAALLRSWLSSAN